jgi:hypothetical protein
MFIRFVSGGDDENVYWLTGIITTARELRDDGGLHDHEVEWLNEIFDWFNTNLPCPPFSEKLESGHWTSDAVAWFRPTAGEAVRRMWEIVAILKEHGIPVQFVRTADPGEIVYQDEYQVVAETWRNA